MRADKPQFWRGGVNLAMIKMMGPFIFWVPIENLKAKTLVDVNIDCREMLKGKVEIMQDGVINEVITTPVQKNIIFTPSHFLSFFSKNLGTYNIADAIYRGKYIDFCTTFETSPVSMMYNNDGTRFYLLGQQKKRISQYRLFTPYDISTGSIQGNLFIQPQDTNPVCTMFNNDGTKLYLLGQQHNSIKEYHLSTPYDILTGTFSRIALNVNAQDTNPVCMMYNNDGTKLYLLGQQHNSIKEYSLSIPYDIFTGTFSRMALNVNAEDTNPVCMMYNNDGTRLYLLGQQHKSIKEYNLSIPYDIATGTFLRMALNVSHQASFPTSMMFDNEGKKLFVLNNQPNVNITDNIYEYSIDGIWTGNVKIRTLSN